MNETSVQLKQQMVDVADDLRRLKCWRCPNEQLAQRLEAMQEGGEPGTNAWVELLKEIVKLPLAERAVAERRLAEYQQLIGRWYMAEHRDRLSRSPFPKALSMAG